MLAQAQPALTFFQRRLSQRRRFFSAGSACVDIFLTQAQPAQANCQRRLSVRTFSPCFDSFFQRRLSLRRHFFSEDSACVDIFLAQAQPAQAFFQRTLSLRKKNKMANICRSLRTKILFSPVLKSLTHIGFIGVKKNGSKISHLGTFKAILFASCKKSFAYPMLYYMLCIFSNSDSAIKKSTFNCEPPTQKLIRVYTVKY